jgi:hypothetical protein
MRARHCNIGETFRRGMQLEQRVVVRSPGATAPVADLPPALCDDGVCCI